MLGPNDRFTLVEQPQAAPGCCFFCKGVTRGPFIDTKAHDLYNNHVIYMCMGCLHNIVDNLEDEFPKPDPEGDQNYEAGYAEGRADAIDEIEAKACAYMAALNDADSDDTAASGTTDLQSEEPTESTSSTQGVGTSPDKTAVKDSNATSGEGPLGLPSRSGNGRGILD